jgi:addiction module HigA family antidote
MIVARHPGYWIHKFLGSALNVIELAEAMQITSYAMRDLLSGAQSITPVIAERLSKVIGGSPDYWMEMQFEYDKSSFRKDASKSLTSSLQGISDSLPDFVKLAISGASGCFFLLVNGSFFPLTEEGLEKDINSFVQSLGEAEDPWDYGYYFDPESEQPEASEINIEIEMVREVKANLGALDALLIVGSGDVQLMLRGGRPVYPLRDVLFSEFLSWLQGLDWESIDPDADFI